MITALPAERLYRYSTSFSAARATLATACYATPDTGYAKPGTTADHASASIVHPAAAPAVTARARIPAGARQAGQSCLPVPHSAPDPSPTSLHRVYLAVQWRRQGRSGL